MGNSSNFVEFDAKNPAEVFSHNEISFALDLPASLDEEDRRRVFGLEEIRFNKTTRVSHFDVVPGLRPQWPKHGCIYFSRFRKGHYDKLVDAFFEYPISKLPEGQKYNAICRNYRILIPDGTVFYPIEFTGDINLTEALYRKAASTLGARLAKFIKGEFTVENQEVYPFREIQLEKTNGHAFPKGW